MINTIIQFPRKAGEELLKAFDEASLNVKAALWLYQPETDTWDFVITTPLVDSEGPFKTYERIRSILEEIRPKLTEASPQFDIELSDISAISPNSNLIRSLQRVVQIEKGQPGMLLRRNDTDGTVEEAYIYRMSKN